MSYKRPTFKDIKQLSYPQQRAIAAAAKFGHVRRGRRDVLSATATKNTIYSLIEFGLLTHGQDDGYYDLTDLGRTIAWGIK